MPVPGRHVNLAQNRPSPTSPLPLIYRVWLCCLGVFADESLEDRSSSHPCRGKIRDHGGAVSAVGGSCCRAWCGRCAL